MRMNAVAALSFLALGLTATAAAMASPSNLKPKAHGNFQHYTLALTWQPGFCAHGSCAANQDHGVDIGLHGLWPSRPENLIDRGIPARKWWSRGCNYYHPSDAAPELGAQTQGALQHVMPQLSHSLLKHEYDKHVQCFNYDPDNFFDTALTLRGRVSGSAFGQWLRQHAGQRVARADVVNTFEKTFSTKKNAAIQLRCSGHGDQQFLSQLWFTIPRDKLADFPKDAGLENAPIAQQNCPAHFRVPAWS